MNRVPLPRPMGPGDRVAILIPTGPESNPMLKPGICLTDMCAPVPLCFRVPGGFIDLRSCTVSHDPILIRAAFACHPAFALRWGSRLLTDGERSPIL